MTPPRLHLTLLAFASVSLVAAHAADARPHKCSEITKGDKNACQREADAACASIKSTPGRMRCEDKFFQKYYACWNGAFAKACVPVEKKYWAVCRKAGQLDTNKPESVKAFVDRAAAYDATFSEYSSYHQEWNVCFGDDRKCQASSSWLSHCKRAKEKFKKTYADAVDFILRADVAQARRYVATTSRRGRQKFAMNAAARAVTKVEMLQSMAAKVPWLAHKTGELAKAISDLQGQSKSARKAMIAAMAKRRCPRARRPNRRLARKLMPAVKQTFRTNSDAKIWVRALRLDGRKTTSYNRYQRVETQAVPAYVCTERKYLRAANGRKPGQRVCAYYSVTLRRSRRFKGKWGAWRVAVGTSKDLLCKHVR